MHSIANLIVITNINTQVAWHIHQTISTMHLQTTDIVPYSNHVNNLSLSRSLTHTHTHLNQHMIILLANHPQRLNPKYTIVATNIA